MTNCPSAAAAQFDDLTIWLDLEDGRTLGVPLVWFPRLFDGTPEQREAVWISPSGLHCDELEEDISIAGLLARREDQTMRHPRAA